MQLTSSSPKIAGQNSLFTMNTPLYLMQDYVILFYRQALSLVYS